LEETGTEFLHDNCDGRLCAAGAILLEGVSVEIGTCFEPRLRVTKMCSPYRPNERAAQTANGLTGRNGKPRRRRRLRRKESDGDDAEEADEAEQSDDLHLAWIRAGRARPQMPLLHERTTSRDGAVCA
jgi:hypothetical protein